LGEDPGEVATTLGALLKCGYQMESMTITVEETGDSDIFIGNTIG
jgi:hypothetical protein